MPSPDSRDLLTKLMGSSFDGIFAVDTAGRVLFWNPAMERIFGVSRDEAVDRNVFELLSFLKETGEDQALDKALAGHSMTRREQRFYVAESGREGWMEGHYAPLRDEGGNIIGVLAVLRDITDLKWAESALADVRRRQRLLLAQLADPRLNPRNRAGAEDRSRPAENARSRVPAETASVPVETPESPPPERTQAQMLARARAKARVKTKVRTRAKAAAAAAGAKGKMRSPKQAQAEARALAKARARAKARALAKTRAKKGTPGEGGGDSGAEAAAHPPTQKPAEKESPKIPRPDLSRIPKPGALPLAAPGAPDETTSPGPDPGDSTGHTPIGPVSEMDSQIFDREAVVGYLRGEEALVGEIAEISLIAIPAMMEELGFAVDAGDCSQVAHMAKELKGTVAAVGGHRATWAAADLERAGDEGRQAIIGRLWTDLSVEMERLCRVLRNQCENNAA